MAGCAASSGFVMRRKDGVLYANQATFEGLRCYHQMAGYA